jgi:3-mercaptopyruvate sulfurtransferase SseA
MFHISHSACAIARVVCAWVAALMVAINVLVPSAHAVSAKALPTTASASPLVSVEWLKEQLANNAPLRLLDASPTPLYKAGHIAGALSVDVFAGGASEPTLAEMQARLTRWGVNADTMIVIYDQGGDIMATSLHHDLLYYGVSAANVRILDGGLTRWRALGGSTTKDAPPPPTPGTIRLSAVDPSVRSQLAQVLAAAGEPTQQVLIDALGADYYYGGAKFFSRGGHLPQAKLMASEEFFNADKTFKSPSEIRRMLTHLGITDAQTVHTYCGGGMAASVPHFALKHLAGMPKVKLYKGSQREWLRDARDLPLWTYPQPHMLRDATWVAGWNSDMLRAYGVAELNIVDVRAPEVFAAGHIPHSLNVPVVSRATELLRQGIDARYETVLVSGGGLSAEAAQMYVALERAGYHKISFLLPSVDDWAFAGKRLAKRAAGDKPTAPSNVQSVPARAPTVASTAPGLSDKPAAPQGPRQRLLATTGSAPAMAATIPVALNALLNANGTPKPAAEIWGVLDKAGVSRYADIECVGDTPGAAEQAYVILKLMGFTRVQLAS